VLIFDEATSNLDQQTAEHFAKTVNKLKGRVAMLFITHQLPKGLMVDEAVVLGKEANNNNSPKHQASQQSAQASGTNLQAHSVDRGDSDD
jgi:subfamily B ATP-binding cassette protein HlyB/CyaB